MMSSSRRLASGSRSMASKSRTTLEKQLHVDRSEEEDRTVIGTAGAASCD